ncbi:ketopantoate reductase family protein [Carnobacterium gallinarum]|uniref:ketopantoate reductase family protein n=1 Tax=Carnobacterium gallinarum TaxID=2749 RepID=UPI000556DDE0|nr:2-dehydropantoate 2-reductase N-terminal domain-containing protein [Carnobacterium gallinarum]
MRILVFGAGTIGLSYAWLLSDNHDVSVYVRSEKEETANLGYSIAVQDLRKEKSYAFRFEPTIVTDLDADYDLILVTVNRCQLAQVLPNLKQHKKNAHLLFMLNHWDITTEIEHYFTKEDYILGFPSQVGGGRHKNKLDIIVFTEGTILGLQDPCQKAIVTKYKEEFDQSDLHVTIQEHMVDWLKIHYLQQSINAGAILKAGGFEEFSCNSKAISEMIIAYREGLKVCEALGVSTKKLFSARMFYYPKIIVTPFMKHIFQKNETSKILQGHMQHGLVEWIYGYQEILKTGEELTIPMPAWHSYETYIDSYLEKNPELEITLTK